LYGDDVPVAVASVKYPGTEWNTRFEGIINFLQKQKDEGTEAIRKWVDDFTITKGLP
jgi:excinuclease ABC subunit A